MFQDRGFKAGLGATRCFQIAVQKKIGGDHDLFRNRGLKLGWGPGFVSRWRLRKRIGVGHDLFQDRGLKKNWGPRFVSRSSATEPSRTCRWVGGFVNLWVTRAILETLKSTFKTKCRFCFQTIVFAIKSTDPLVSPSRSLRQNEKQCLHPPF